MKLPHFVSGWFCLRVFCLSGVLCSAGLAQALDAPDGEALLVPEAAARTKVIGRAAGASSLQEVAVEGLPFQRAWRVAVRERQEVPHHIQLAVPVAGAIDRGDVLFLEFWARLVSTEHETGMIDANNVIELNAAPYSKVLNPRPWSAGVEWKRILTPFVSNASIPAESAVINFRLGGAVQTVEIGGVSLLRLPAGTRPASLPATKPDLYAGHEDDAPWRAVAAERIRTHRMEDIVVRVRDAQGRPLRGVAVRVDQASHAFRFGVAVNTWGLFRENPTEEQEKYGRMIPRYFNQGTLESGHKWPVWINRREQAARATEWMLQQGMTVRGHVLFWPSWRRNPESLRALADRPDVLKERIAEHFEDILGATDGKITDWDVVNEPQTHFDILDVLGHDYVITAFQMARRLAPRCRLFLNEALNFNAVDKLRVFERQALDWRSRGAPIDGLGIQAHYSGWSLTPPEKIWAELDRLAAHGFALQVTEFDIDIDDEDLQARYLRDFYTAVFAHPAVDTIQMWGFWEGRHWKISAALWRRDWSLKPAGRAYVDLMEKEWRTRGTLVTDSAGEASLRGFLGGYTLTLTRGDETREVKFDLVRGAGPVDVTW